MTRTSGLGLYLGTLAVAQIAIYVAWTSRPDSSLFYFDPRIGLFIVQSMMSGREPPGPALLGWLSALWLLVEALLMGWTRWGPGVYLVSELILALPSLIFFITVAVVNMSPAHGFSVAELTIPVPVFVLFSVVPAIGAYRLWRRNGVAGVV